MTPRIAQETPLIETAIVWRGEEEIPVLREFLKVVSPADKSTTLTLLS